MRAALLVLLALALAAAAARPARGHGYVLSGASDAGGRSGIDTSGAGRNKNNGGAF